MKVLVLHGPNLNLLGEREVGVYGKLTLSQLNAQIRRHARALKLTVRIFQSNHEGALIDKLHQSRRWMDALVINPGALTHYSYSLRDAIAGVNTRAWEVHLSDIGKREPWRRVSVIEDVVTHRVIGKGPEGYQEALEFLAERGKKRT